MTCVCVCVCVCVCGVCVFVCACVCACVCVCVCVVNHVVVIVVVVVVVVDHTTDQFPLSQQQKLKIYRLAICPCLTWLLAMADLPFMWVERTP